MERIVQIVIISIIHLVAALIAIILAKGQPLGSMSGWGGVLLLIFIGLAVALLFWIFKTLIGGTYDSQQVLGLTAACTVATLVALLLFGTVGLEWLRELRSLLRGGGIWWPLVIVVASVITVVVLTPKRRRVTA